MIGRLCRNIGKWLRENAPFSFMNTEQEWHAFVMGFGEGFYPLAFLFRWAAPLCLINEPHYYRFGQAVGFAALLAALGGLVVWLR